MDEAVTEDGEVVTGIGDDAINCVVAGEEHDPGREGIEKVSGDPLARSESDHFGGVLGVVHTVSGGERMLQHFDTGSMRRPKDPLLGITPDFCCCCWGREST